VAAEDRNADAMLTKILISDFKIVPLIIKPFVTDSKKFLQTNIKGVMLRGKAAVGFKDTYVNLQ
jgi:hypothetical protein